MKMLPSFKDLRECYEYFALVLHFGRFFAGLSRLQQTRELNISPLLVHVFGAILNLTFGLMVAVLS